MYFEVGQRIYARNATDELLAWCRQNLVLDNPEYFKRLAMGKWCGNTPEHIYLYVRNGADIILPFGCIKKIRELFGDYRFYGLMKTGSKVDYKSIIDPYPYQEEAVVSAIKAKNGVIVMPCGSGKTQTALEIIARLGLKTLWLTHTQDLLNQSMNRAKSVFCCSDSLYGTITDGKVNIGSGLTFATVQTMSRLNLQDYKDVWDVVVVDECHKAVGSPTKVMQFYKVLSSLACRYKYGLTATPKRADGLEESMFALLGDIIVRVDKAAVADTTCPVGVMDVLTGYIPDLDMALAGDGTINYAGLVKDLVHNKERFNLVSAILNGNCRESTLVLANRVEYLEELQKSYKRRSVCLSGMGHSKAAKAERKEALNRLNSGDLDCVFATYQLAKEGLDVPNLRYVVFATPEKDETTVMQAAGRVGRKAAGKDFGTVIDLIDDFGMYKGWAKKRKIVYKKLGYNMLT